MALTWTNSGSLNIARAYHVGVGVKSASLAFGGYVAGGNRTNTNEEFNGSSWTNKNLLNYSLTNASGCGTTFSALCFAGEANISAQYPNKTQLYNGTIWSIGNGFLVADINVGGCGTQSAALAVGGSNSPTTVGSFNGITWSVLNSLVTGLQGCFSVGGLSSALGVNNNSVQKYNGTTWTTAQMRNVANSGCVTGTPLYAISTGIYTTEIYDGTTWVIDNHHTSFGRDAKSSGLGNIGILFGGQDNNFIYQSTTEIYSPLIFSNNYSYRMGVWSSSTNMTSSRKYHCSFGVSSAAVCVGGWFTSSSYTSSAEKYNGTTWSNASYINVANYNMGSCGTQTAGLAIGGENSSTTTHFYNDTSWITIGILNAARVSSSACGTSNAALVRGNGNTAEIYNGTSWNLVANLMSTNRLGGGTVGSSNSAITYSGITSEKFNGTTWINDANLIYDAGSGNFGANQNLAITAGSTLPQRYNGTSWTVITQNLLNHSGGAGCGNSMVGLITGGSNTSTLSPSVEKYNDIISYYTLSGIRENSNNILYWY